jgi:hypothetical protein
VGAFDWRSVIRSLLRGSTEVGRAAPCLPWFGQAQLRDCFTAPATIGSACTTLQCMSLLALTCAFKAPMLGQYIYSALLMLDSIASQLPCTAADSVTQWLPCCAGDNASCHVIGLLPPLCRLSCPAYLSVCVILTTCFLVGVLLQHMLLADWGVSLTHRRYNLMLNLERPCAQRMASMGYCTATLCAHLLSSRVDIVLILGWLIPSEMVTGPTCNYSLSLCLTSCLWH